MTNDVMNVITVLHTAPYTHPSDSSEYVSLWLVSNVFSVRVFLSALLPEINKEWLID